MYKHINISDVRICELKEETDDDILVHLSVKSPGRIIEYEHYVRISSVLENAVSIIRIQTNHFYTPHIYSTECKISLGQD
jgi:hypothetical protein